MKSTKDKTSAPRAFEPRIKWVRKANMWATITQKEGKQHIEWSAEKPILKGV